MLLQTFLHSCLGTVWSIFGEKLIAIDNWELLAVWGYFSKYCSLPGLRAAGEAGVETGLVGDGDTVLLGQSLALLLGHVPALLPRHPLGLRAAPLAGHISRGGGREVRGIISMIKSIITDTAPVWSTAAEVLSGGFITKQKNEGKCKKNVKMAKKTNKTGLFQILP